MPIVLSTNQVLPLSDKKVKLSPVNENSDEQIKSQVSKVAHVTRGRSILKTVSWRFFASIDTFVITYIATGNVKIGAAIVSVEIITKMILYYLHERGWAHVRWGVK